MRSKSATHCANDACGKELPLSGAWGWRARVFCSEKCANTLQWPNPDEKAAIEIKLSAMRQERGPDSVELSRKQLLSNISAMRRAYKGR